MLNNTLIQLIEDSFQDVKIENGIGYFQSIVIDNLDGKNELQAAIKKDMEFGDDWMKLKTYIKANDLDWFPYAFMDYKGIRFLLPVLLTLEIKITLNGLMKEILHYNKLIKEDFWDEFLNLKQRQAIKEVYRFWHKENLEYLIICGMTKESALNDIKFNKSLNVENYSAEIVEILELIDQKTNL